MEPLGWALVMTGALCIFYGLFDSIEWPDDDLMMF